MTHSINWSPVTSTHVMTAIQEYDDLGAEIFFAKNGFAPATTYQLGWNGKSYPPKAILGRAYELATGEQLRSSDFEGGKSGAVKVLTRLGFEIEAKTAR